MVTATVQIILDVVRHGYLKISDFNLIVFDECHHAQKDHPMLLLMTKFRDVPPSEHPRVIGLTGMLTSDSVKPQNVLEDLQRLEGTYRATITTARGDSFSDVLIHSTKPKESIITYEQNSIHNFEEKISKKILRMIEVIKSWPMDDTHERSRDPRNKKQPKAQTKFERIVRDFHDHLSGLGTIDSFFKKKRKVTRC